MDQRTGTELAAVGSVQPQTWLRMTDPTRIVHEFVARINRHDVAALAELMAPDHRLIDPLGAVVSGAGPLRDAWRRYFEMVPDYRVEVDDSLARGDTVVLVGRAGGTYAPGGVRSSARRWPVPAAWRALIRGEHVVEWQVYADNAPLRSLVTGAGSAGSGGRD